MESHHCIIIVIDIVGNNVGRIVRTNLQQKLGMFTKVGGGNATLDWHRRNAGSATVQNVEGHHCSSTIETMGDRVGRNARTVLRKTTVGLLWRNAGSATAQTRQRVCTTETWGRLLRKRIHCIVAQAETPSRVLIVKK